MRLLLILAAGIVALLSGVLAGCDGWAKSAMALTAGAPVPAEAAKPIDLPQNLTPEQTRDLLLRLSDEQLRALLLSQLDKAAAATAPAPHSSDMVFDLMQSMNELRGRLDAMLSALPNLTSIGSFVLKQVTKGYEPDHIWMLAAETIAVFVVALIGKAVFRKVLRPVISRLPVLDARSDFGKLGVLLLRAVIQLIELAVFGVVAVIAFFCLYDGHEAARLAFWAIFLFIVLFRASSIVLRLFLAPYAPALRLPLVDDAAARRLYRDFLFLVALSLFYGLTVHFLVQIDVAPELMLAFGQLLFLVNLTAIIAVIGRRRFDIAHLVGLRTAASDERPMGLGGLFSAYWHKAYPFRSGHARCGDRRALTV